MKKNYILFLMLAFVGWSNMVKGQVPPNWAWANSTGGNSDDKSNSISTDATGNTYITGNFTSSNITFGTTSLTNSGYEDIFIAKYDANGNVIWAKSAGGIGYDSGLGIITDAAGNTFITGYFASPTITFGTISLTNNVGRDIFIVKYDTNGNVLWAKSFGGNLNDWATSIAKDAAGNIYITGEFSSSTIAFGATTLMNNNNSTDIFIAKYDTNGNALWAKSAGGASSDAGESIVTDAAGNTYITGYFQSPTIIFGVTTLSNNGNYDILIAKYDTNGNILWAKSAGGTDYDSGYGIATDATGNTTITGYFASPTITFGTTTLTNNGVHDVFIAKYDTNGNMLWAKSSGGTSIDEGNSITTDVAGNTTIIGNFSSPTIAFGATTLTNNNNSGNYDIFIAKYNTNGNVLWANSVGETYGDTGYGITTDAAGCNYITGYFDNTTINFGATTLTNNGWFDIYIAKLNATTGIAEIENNAAMVISPNPFSNYTTITLPTTQQPATIILTDILGKEIRTIPHVRDRQVVIEKGEMKPGIYLLTITTQAGVENRKIVVE